MKKRLVAILMTAVMLFSMAGCGSTSAESGDVQVSASTRESSGGSSQSISADTQNAIG